MTEFWLKIRAFRIKNPRHQDEIRDASYEVRVFLSQSSRIWSEMIVFLSALRKTFLWKDTYADLFRQQTDGERKTYRNSC